MESLNDYIIEHLKKGKYEKTLKLFEEKNRGSKNENSKIYEKFINYLKGKKTKKENEIDDLGFEINFGAFSSESKVSFLLIYQLTDRILYELDCIFTFSRQHQAVESQLAKNGSLRRPKLRKKKRRLIFRKSF